jgi:hypothetical protein
MHTKAFLADLKSIERVALVAFIKSLILLVYKFFTWSGKSSGRPARRAFPASCQTFSTELSTGSVENGKTLIKSSY